jgi:hypothetical protein
MLWKRFRRSDDPALLQYNTEVNASNATPNAVASSHNVIK